MQLYTSEIVNPKDIPKKSGSLISLRGFNTSPVSVYMHLGLGFFAYVGFAAMAVLWF
jgi:hypothetical protein